MRILCRLDRLSNRRHCNSRRLVKYKQWERVDEGRVKGLREKPFSPTVEEMRRKSRRQMTLQQDRLPGKHRLGSNQLPGKHRLCSKAESNYEPECHTGTSCIVALECSLLRISEILVKPMLVILPRGKNMCAKQ